MGKGADARRKAKRGAKNGGDGGGFETGRRKKPKRSDSDYNSGKDNGGRARYEDFQKEGRPSKKIRREGDRAPQHSRTHRTNSSASLIRGPKGGESAKFAKRREAAHERERLQTRAKMSRERQSERAAPGGSSASGGGGNHDRDQQREWAERKRERRKARDNLCREIQDLIESFATGEQVSTGQCNRALKRAVELRDLLCAMTVWAGLQCGDIIAGSGDVEEVNGADDETYRQLASLHDRGSWKTLRHTSLGGELFEKAVSLCGIAEGAVAQSQEGEGDLTTLDHKTAMVLRASLAALVKKRSVDINRTSLMSGSLLDTPHELAAEWVRANPATVEACANRFKLASALAKACKLSSKNARAVLAVLLKEGEVLREKKKKFTVLQEVGAED
jgi:hypothetical protein